MSLDLEAARRHLGERDAELGCLIERIGVFEPPRRQFDSPFEALVHAIVFQQLSGKSASAIHARLLASFPGRHPTPRSLAELTEEQSRTIGLSKAKTLALKDLAARAADGRLPDGQQMRTLADEEIVACSRSVRGVGLWTAQMMLIFYLHRPDVLPATDLGIRKGFARVFAGPLPAPAELSKHAERWRPFRTVASLYLWEATRL